MAAGMWERKQALERELPGKRAPGEVRVQPELEGERVQLRRECTEGERGEADSPVGPEPEERGSCGTPDLVVTVVNQGVEHDEIRFESLKAHSGGVSGL